MELDLTAIVSGFIANALWFGTCALAVWLRRKVCR